MRDLYSPRRAWFVLAAATLAGCGIANAQSCSGWLSTPPSDTPNNIVYMLNVLPDGRTIASGNFDHIGASSIFYNHIAMWDGMSWEPLGSGVDELVNSFARLRTGELVAGGYFTHAGGTDASRVAKWNGSEWSPLGPDVINSAVRDLAVMPNGDLIAGGYFGRINDTVMKHVARWDGTTWHPLGAGISRVRSIGVVYSLCARRDGTLVVGGDFDLAGDTPVANVASWDGHTWSALGAGLGDVGSSTYVIGVIETTDGKLVAWGRFSGTPSNPQMRNLASWDGANWSAVENPIRSDMACVFESADGSLIVSGLEGCFRRSGGNWTPLDIDAVHSTVYVLAEHPSGELLAGGTFLQPWSQHNYFARWSDSGMPWVARQPEAARVEAGQTVTLTAAPATGYQGVSVRWLRSGVPVHDGAGGAAEGGGTVSGASVSLESPTSGGIATLTITNARPVDSGVYTAEVLNECGSRSSNAVFVRVGCPADFDRDGFVDGLDYDAFVGCFEGVSCPLGQSADFNLDGFPDAFDYDDFVAAFESGCG